MKNVMEEVAACLRLEMEGVWAKEEAQASINKALDHHFDQKGEEPFNDKSGLVDIVIKFVVVDSEDRLIHASASVEDVLAVLRKNERAKKIVLGYFVEATELMDEALRDFLLDGEQFYREREAALQEKEFLEKHCTTMLTKDASLQ